MQHFDCRYAVFILSLYMLNATMTSVDSQHKAILYAESLHAACCFNEFQYVLCHYVKCLYAECHHP
jgi:hypothetical protein